MHKYAWIAVIGLLFAGCGDDDKDPAGKGGSGGEGGGGPIELPAGVTITNEAGRTFVGPRAQITIKERTGGEVPQIEGHIASAVEGTNLEYDVLFRLSKDQLIDGEANPNLSGAFPDRPGLGKVEVDTDSTTLISNGSTDSLNLTFDRGALAGDVESPKSEMKATITGSYDLQCNALIDGTLKNDANFESTFCQAFAAQRPQAK